MDDFRYPPPVEDTSNALLKYLWSKTKKVDQDDLDYFNGLLKNLYDEAQRIERFERRRVEALKRKEANK